MTELTHQEILEMMAIAKRHEDERTYDYLQRMSELDLDSEEFISLASSDNLWTGMGSIIDCAFSQSRQSLEVRKQDNIRWARFLKALGAHVLPHNLRNERSILFVVNAIKLP